MTSSQKHYGLAYRAAKAKVMKTKALRGGEKRSFETVRAFYASSWYVP